LFPPPPPPPRRGEYALALLDMRMPHLSGVDLFRALRAVDPALPAVAMSAMAREEHVLGAVGDGVHAVMPKPVAPAALVALLRTVLDGPAALVVDDDRSFAANLVEALQHHGVSARAATTCAAARASLDARAPRLLVVDARLPDGDGAALIHEAAARGGPIRCVLVSAWDIHPDPAALLQDGIEFLPKPFTLDAVLRGLDRPGGPGAGGAP
jgi:DNA-binding response OmpR family regulator